MKKDFYQHYFEVEKNHWLMKGRRAVCRALLNDIGAHKESSILDVGCGAGFLLGELQHDGYTHAHGVDMEAGAIEFGKEKGVENLSVSRNEEIPFQNATQDIVISMDVLEHTPDDASSIREMYRVLKPGGHMVIFVPAYMFLWGVQDEVAHHYRRYTLGTLIQRVRHVGGLTIVRRSYFNTFLFPLIAAVRLLSWVFSFKSRESDFDLNNAFLNAVFGAVFTLERACLRFVNFPFGVSIALVVKKEV